MGGCVHRLVFQFQGPYRYRCVRCFARLKIASGMIMTDERAKQWFNEHGGQWGWEQHDKDELERMAG